LSRDRLLALAVRAHPPLRLAETFASYAGQFYDRTAFDLLARVSPNAYGGRFGHRMLPTSTRRWGAVRSL
jgi:hypothetical protein